MSLLEKIPTMDDDQVINLLVNARRLHEQGDEKQQAAAAELLPALEEVAAATGQAIPQKAQDIALSALTRAGSPIKA